METTAENSSAAMRVVGERIFTLADQRDFAALSGDYNPVHVDEVAARRTVFGAPVVHGLHLLCWALESWVGQSRRSRLAMQRISAKFFRGILVGEAALACAMNDQEDCILRIRRQQSEMVWIRVKLGPAAEYAEALPAMNPSECRVMDPAEIAHAAGSVPLAYSAPDAARLLPQLSAALPPLQLAALLATTRLVGMECPGLHSMYSGLDLTFAEQAAGKPRMNYRVTLADRNGGVSLSVDGPGFQGELRAFLRPAPCRQAAARDLVRLVAGDAFSTQRAVVIGGSRGLGEVTAKLLAMGGAEVTITYHRGKADAEAVAAEIHAAGGKCRVAQFDCNHPAPIALAQPLTHLYYFATPHITADKTVPFSTERFAEYCRYYAAGFAQTLLAVAQGAPALKVFYPSTVFLDEAPAHLGEYCAAKAAGEELCRQLGKTFPAWAIFAPRLPRMLTDQNNGFRPAKMEPPETVILRHLEEMQAKSSRTI